MLCKKLADLPQGTPMTCAESPMTSSQPFTLEVASAAAAEVAGNRHGENSSIPNFGENLSGWWFQPIWKILLKMGIFPKIGVKRKNLWNHHLALHGQNGLPGFSQKKHALNATTRLKSYFTKASHNASPKLARLSTSSHVVQIAWKAIDQEVRLAFLLPRTHGLHT